MPSEFSVTGTCTCKVGPWFKRTLVEWFMKVYYRIGVIINRKSEAVRFRIVTDTKNAILLLHVTMRFLQPATWYFWKSIVIHSVTNEIKSRANQFKAICPSFDLNHFFRCYIFLYNRIGYKFAKHNLRVINHIINIQL